MQVRVFEAKDMNTGLKMVKESLGPDALILSTRTVRKGMLGRHGSQVLEITAAIEGSKEARQEEIEVTERQLLYSKPIRQAEEEIHQDTYLYNARAERQLRHPAYAGVEEGPINSNTELDQLRQLVQGLSNKLQALEARPQEAPYYSPGVRLERCDKQEGPVVDFLLRRGVGLEAARMVARFSTDLFGDETPGSQDDLLERLQGTIARLFTVKRLLQDRIARQRRIALVGATGVGKTTTIAKMAANYLGRFRGRVALFTIDTYRIAAVEQLKVYGEIMRMPVEVIIHPEEMAQRLDRYRDYDLILIDTAGRSPRHNGDLQEMTAFFRPEFNIEHHLLLSSTAREAELTATIRSFSLLPLHSFIFSKIDEAGLLGVLLNVHFREDTPISFLTNGQRVPEDILSPDPDLLATMILNDHRMHCNG
jgi:flagellar biosynthesis protein FlhF